MPPSSRIVNELKRRKGIIEGCFPRQQQPIIDVIDGGERRVAVLTSRRAGKTNGALSFIARDALDHPNCRYAYIGLSRVTAENIVWKELERINDAHNLQLDMQGYRLRSIFPNGSDLTLYGADQPGWIKKFKGAKYRAVIIDEAGEFDIDLQDFIFRVIRPTLTDLRGSLWLIGTPGVVPSGYWWAVTNPDVTQRVKGWHVYNWHAFDNPFIAEQFRDDMEELRSIYGDELESLPWYRREWLGEWCSDTSRNVYKYASDKNDLLELRPRHPGDKYILTIDPGVKDSTGCVVGVYNKAVHDELHILECYKKPGLHLDELVALVNQYRAKYPNIRIIGDPDAAHFMAFMRERCHIPIEDAQKINKQQNIEYLNNSLLAGKVKFKMPECYDVVKEMMELTKEYRKSDERQEGRITLGEWKEHPKQSNDLCDCVLYMHRVALNYLHTEPPPKVEYGTADYYNRIEEKLRESAKNKALGSQPWWRKI